MLVEKNESPINEDGLRFSGTLNFCIFCRWLLDYLSYAIGIRHQTNDNRRYNRDNDKLPKVHTNIYADTGPDSECAKASSTATTSGKYGCIFVFFFSFYNLSRPSN